MFCLLYARWYVFRGLTHRYFTSIGRLRIGNIEQVTITFKNRASGRHHDAVLRKFLETFLERDRSQTYVLFSLYGVKMTKQNLCAVLIQIDTFTGIQNIPMHG